MANRNYPNGKSIYIPHIKPVLLDCNFIVDSTNGNGLGIRSLKGSYIQNVFMNTSSTPGVGNSNNATPNIPITNPNPQAGIIVVQFQDNYVRSLSGFSAYIPPVSGSSLAIDGSNLTVGHAYTIVSLGTSTTADWITVGVPIGVIPAVGVTFIAAAAGAGSGSGAVEAPAAAGSGIQHIETIGDPNTTLSPNPASAQGYGGSMILACYNSSSNANALTAPC